ncbi:hypothetical protein AALA44_02655 [Enterococcus ratti]|uniref:hypothetical protein n=1 Tax=Enterococcus ratti TaxID=150033 RepID=UPI0035138B5F
MYKLLKIELMKVDCKHYLGIAFLIPVVVLAFLYFFASIPHFDPTVQISDSEIASYSFILNMAFLLNSAGFIFLGATMLGKLIIESYSNKNIYLTLSYPVSRERIFFSKLGIVCLLGSILSALSLAIIDIVFLSAEKILPLVHDQLNIHLLVKQIPMIFLSILLIPAIDTCSLWIGWKKRSIALTFFSSLVLFSLVGNSASLGTNTLFYIFTIFYFFGALFSSLSLVNQVKRIEV